MTLKIHEWNSFSCNNSSDYRLVATFDDAKQASAMAKELRSFFAKHAKEYDKQSDDDDFDWPGEPTKHCHKLGEKYGHKWGEFLIWGDEGLQGDEPAVVSMGDTLVLYHTYSSGGFGPDVPAVIKKAGGKLPEKGAIDSAPILRVEFDVPPKSAASVEEALRSVFEQRHTVEYKSDWELRSGDTDYAFGEGNGDVDDVTFWFEDGHCVFTYSLRPDYFDNLKGYLKKQLKVRNLEIRLATDKDVKANKKVDVRLEKKRQKAATAVTTKRKKKQPSFNPSGLSFLFTGKLAAMSRAEAQSRAKSIGGKVAPSVTPTLDVLVVGDEGSPLYGDGKKGAKLTKAEKLNDSGAKIRIISETEFLQLGG